MTTIVFRAGVLAADSQVSGDCIRVGHCDKIMRAGPGWVAMAGTPADLLEVADWLKGWPEIGDAPERVKSANTRGFFVLPDGVVYQVEGARLWEMRAEFFAEGSGRDLAVGAMAMGAGAVDAVRIATGFDACTGGPIQTVKVL